MGLGQIMQIPAELRSLPNQLTLLRIAAIPVICLLIVMGWDWLRWIALVLYVVAAVTDWLDGFLARRMNLGSDLGRMLDPIADKLLVGALLVTFAWTRDFSLWELPAAIAILMREIFVSGLREYLGNRSVTVPVTFLAKWKTTLQLVALFFVIVDGLLAELRLHLRRPALARRAPHRLDRLAISRLDLGPFRQPAGAARPARSMKILYFALFRERLGRGEEEVTPPASVTTVRDLIAWLRSRDPVADLVFEKEHLIRAAIDARLAKLDSPIAGASVVALLPPMTGG